MSCSCQDTARLPPSATSAATTRSWPTYASAEVAAKADDLRVLPDWHGLHETRNLLIWGRCGAMIDHGFSSGKSWKSSTHLPKAQLRGEQSSMATEIAENDSDTLERPAGRDGWRLGKPFPAEMEAEFQREMERWREQRMRRTGLV